MAVIVVLSTIVTQESHGVALSNVLGVVLHEILNAIPKSRDGLDIFVQTQHETVLLLVLGHETEGVVVDVAEKLDAGLHSPVPFIVHHERLTEKEARLEAAHVTVADRIAIDNFALGHILPYLARLVLVDMVRERPVLVGNLAIVRLAGNQGTRHLLEGRVERLIVEKYPVVIESAVEAILDLTDRAGNVPHIAVSGKTDKGSIHSRTRSSSQ